MYCCRPDQILANLSSPEQQPALSDTLPELLQADTLPELLHTVLCAAAYCVLCCAVMLCCAGVCCAVLVRCWCTLCWYVLCCAGVLYAGVPVCAVLCWCTLCWCVLCCCCVLLTWRQILLWYWCTHGLPCALCSFTIACVTCSTTSLLHSLCELEQRTALCLELSREAPHHNTCRSLARILIGSQRHTDTDRQTLHL